MSQEIVRKGYDKIAVRYMDARDQLVNYRYLERLNNLIMPCSTILDIGCGAGKPIDRFFINKGHRVIGIDISRKQIRLAKRNVPQASYSVKDVSGLQIEEYQVDAIISYYTIIHIPRETHEELFLKINSFLPKGGLVLVTMGSSEWEGIEDFYGVKMYFSHYGPEKNREMIEKVAAQHGVPLIGIVPLDEFIKDADKKAIAPIDLNPESPGMLAIKQIKENLIEQKDFSAA